MIASHKNNRRGIVAAALFLFPFLGLAQEKKEASLVFWGFLDTYYGYDFNNPATTKRLSFLYNHTRSQTPAVNLVLFAARFETGRFRANLALQEGTYVQDNYASEPRALRWIHQANLGLALNNDKNLWLELGVFPSHIGFESAISSENITRSRSLIAENSPYFETGAKLSWKPCENWQWALLYLNGWQRIRAIPGENNPSFGTQATFTPKQGVTFNWSTFFGTDQGKAAETRLFFHNFYGDFLLGPRWRIIGGIDFGKRTTRGLAAKNWGGAALLARYAFPNSWSAAVRLEQYSDPDQALVTTVSNIGIKASGASFTIDKDISPQIKIGLEARRLQNGSSLYALPATQRSENWFLLAMLSYRLKELQVLQAK
jgi:hypothetical protein